MAFYMVGLGLGSEKDMTLRGKEVIEKCGKVYLEEYTSKLVEHDHRKLEKMAGKKVVIATRDMVEEGAEKMVKEAKKEEVALLVVGSPFAATTHAEFLLLCRKHAVKMIVVDNASVLTAVGVTGLSLYKFGRVTTIPFENKDVRSPYNVVE